MPDSDSQVQRSAVLAGRLLEAFVFVPLGAGAKLVIDGPAAVARARQELSNARFIGELVVGQGAAQLKQRLAAPAVDSTPANSVSGSNHSVSEPEPTPVDDETDDDETDDAVVDVDALGIPDYDSQPAIDIVGLLDSLTPTELSAVEAYERAHRRRRTVLGKLAQLSGDA
jgi:hypothetical protein